MDTVLTITADLSEDAKLRLMELLPECDGYAFGPGDDPHIVRTATDVEIHLTMLGLVRRWPLPVDLAYVAEWVVGYRNWLEKEPAPSSKKLFPEYFRRLKE